MLPEAPKPVTTSTTQRTTPRSTITSRPTITSTTTTTTTPKPTTTSTTTTPSTTTTSTTTTTTTPSITTTSTTPRPYIPPQRYPYRPNNYPSRPNNRYPYRADTGPHYLPRTTSTTESSTPKKLDYNPYNNTPLVPTEVTLTNPKHTTTIERERNPDGSYDIDTSNIPKDRWTNVIGKETPDDYDANRLFCSNGYESNERGQCVGELH